MGATASYRPALWVLVCWVAAGCGRLGYDSVSGSPGDGGLGDSARSDVDASGLDGAATDGSDATSDAARSDASLGDGDVGDGDVGDAGVGDGAAADTGTCLLRSACGACVDPNACAVACTSPQTCGGGGTDGACGATYYVASVGGSDSASGLSVSEAWATFTHAWATMAAGDALVLLDGVYTQALAPSLSGTADAPVRICAETDGGATIDGEGARIPCEINGGDTTPLSYITLEGVVCRSSVDDVVYVNDAHHIEIRRVSAYDAGGIAGEPGNNFLLYQVQDSLLEDVAASGNGQSVFQMTGSARNTIRRCWGRWVSSLEPNNQVIMISWSNENTVENCVLTAGPSPSQNLSGVGMYVASRNTVRGTVVYEAPGDEVGWAFVANSSTEQLVGNRVEHSAAINTGGGLFERSDSDLQLRWLTFVGVTNNAFQVLPGSTEPKEAGFVLNADLRDSVLTAGGTGIRIGSSGYIGSITYPYNDLFGLAQDYAGASPDPTNVSIDPAYDVRRYGRGAYLIAPGPLSTAGDGGGPMGAEVLYRYEDGVLGTEPLWPWPMEDRIMRETGRSVTWESGGGLWLTLDGVYP